MRAIGLLLSFVGLSTTVAGFSIGRAAASVTVTPSLSLSGQYSDNFFFSAQDREDELTTIIAPAVDLLIGNRDVSLTTRYQGGAEFHVRHPKDNRYTQGLNFGLELPILSRQIEGMQVRVIEHTSYTAELPAFSFSDQAPDALDSNEGIQVPRTNTFRNQAGIAVTYPWSHRFSTTVSYTHLITRYRGAALQDSVVQDTNIKGAYQQSPRTTWSLAYGVAVTDYSRVEDVFSQRWSVGVGHQVTPTISLDGNLGASTIRDESIQVTSDIGIQKNYRTGSASFRYIRSIGSGGGLVASATLSQRVTGQITWGLAENTSAYVQAAYGKNLALPHEELDSSSYEAGAGINVSLRSWLIGSLIYSHLNQEAVGVVGTDGTRNLILLTLTATGRSWKVIK